MLGCTESPVRVVSRPLLRCSPIQNLRIRRGDNYPDAGGLHRVPAPSGRCAEPTKHRSFATADVLPEAVAHAAPERAVIGVPGPMGAEDFFAFFKRDRLFER